jgi:SAM-dependent methyltransferase
VADLETHREESLASWQKCSANWGRHRDYLWSQTEPISRRLVERLELDPGDVVLDVAAGTGDTGFLAARRVGSEGRVITTDFAPRMVEEARRAGEAEGLENVEYRVLDAERMELDDDSVDAVVCRFGFMLMPEPERALAETRRVLRDGGRLSFAVWGPPERNPWAALPAREMIEQGLMEPPEPGGPGIFALAEPDRIAALVTGAGFSEPEIEPFEIVWRYGEPEGHWSLVTDLSGRLADALEDLDDEQRERVRLAVRAKVEPLIAEHRGVPGFCHLVFAS